MENLMKVVILFLMLIVSGIPFSYGNEAVVAGSEGEMRTMDLDEYSNGRREDKKTERGGWKNDPRGVLQTATEEEAQTVNEIRASDAGKSHRVRRAERAAEEKE